jgi:UDP-N-acetylmuramate dehydrogenase
MHAPADLRLLLNEPMSRHTSFHVGGPADVFAVVTTPVILHEALQYACEHGLPSLVIGSGTNLLVSDSGYRGMVIRNAISPRLHSVRSSPAAGEDLPFDVLSSSCGANTLISVASGVNLSTLACSTAERGLSGLEWAGGIPGTVGGAVAGNAGAHGGCISDRLIAVEVLTWEGTLNTIPASELRFSYRSSPWRRQEGAGCHPLTRAVFSLDQGDRAELLKELADFRVERANKQPKGWSAGSVFRNPAGESAGRLIELAGLKGYRLGAARVSDLHANFIVNTSSATASQILELICLCRSRVRDQFGVELDTEIVIIGES